MTVCGGNSFILELGLIDWGFSRPLARACGVRCTQNLPKGLHLATKCVRNGVFCRKVKGVRFKKSTFLVQKVYFFWVLHPLTFGVLYPASPESILAAGLGFPIRYTKVRCLKTTFVLYFPFFSVIPFFFLSLIHRYRSHHWQAWHQPSFKPYT